MSSSGAAPSRPRTRLRAHPETYRLIAIVCDNSRDFSVLAELHELGRFCAFLILVAKHKTEQTVHHIEEFKLQVWIHFQPSLEVVAQGGTTLDRSGWIIQDLGCHGRSQDSIRIVMRHDRVQVV